MFVDTLNFNEAWVLELAQNVELVNAILLVTCVISGEPKDFDDEIRR